MNVNRDGEPVRRILRDETFKVLRHRERLQ